MIVYVETNFLLELALGQQELQAATALLDLAEQRAFTLAIPSFCFSEAFATLAERERSRRNLRSNLSEHIRQLKRSEPLQNAAAALEPLLQFLQGLEQDEFGRLQSAVGRVLASAQMVELTSEVFLDALNAEDQFGLSPQDAIIYASVLKHLRGQPAAESKIFASLNWKDFRDPGLIEQLHTYGCRYEESFHAALARVRSESA